MTAKFRPCKLMGKINAPPSKSMTHRYLVGAGLSKEKCVLKGVDYSEDILASIDCLKALGAKITTAGDKVSIDPEGFMKTEEPVLECRESGSTLRFFIPLCLCCGKKIILKGSSRLFERPLDIYEELCRENGFCFEKEKNSLTVMGKFKSGAYKIRGDISSQFISGIIFALVYLGGDSTIEIIPPFESRSYINLTISALKSFGADVEFIDELKIRIGRARLHSFSGEIEGDYSNAAFFAALNELGSGVIVNGLSPDSLQGDKIYAKYFEMISRGTPTIHISDCPDLGPVLFALAACRNGGIFTGTSRLKIKESDRAAAMAAELAKFGVSVNVEADSVVVYPADFHAPLENLCGHNDHRIVMSLSVMLTLTGGIIEGAEAVSKSMPDFFGRLKDLGIKVIEYADN